MTINEHGPRRPGRGYAAWASFSAILLSVGGCAFGSKVLEDPQPVVESQVIVTGSDEALSASLDMVVVRDGPGSWVSLADWDEYVFRISNRSENSIQVLGLEVIDSQGNRLLSSSDRAQLVEGTRVAVSNYRYSGIEISAGPGTYAGPDADTGTDAGAATTRADAAAATPNTEGDAGAGSDVGVGTAVAAGTAMTVVGAGAIAAGAATTTTSFATLASGAAASTLLGPLVILGPLLIAGSIGQNISNSEIEEEIRLRATVTPMEISAGAEQSIHVFFPLAPSPRQVELRYSDAGGEHVLIIDTRHQLNKLHVVATGLPPIEMPISEEDVEKIYQFDNGAALPPGLEEGH